MRPLDARRVFDKQYRFVLDYRRAFRRESLETHFCCQSGVAKKTTRALQRTSIGSNLHNDTALVLSSENKTFSFAAQLRVNMVQSYRFCAGKIPLLIMRFLFISRS